MITPNDLHNLATYLVDRHGPTALTYASHAVEELETQGELMRADAWKALRSVVEDLVEGRISAGQRLTVH